MGGFKEKNKIINRFKKEIKEIFGDLVNYAFLAGRFAFEKAEKGKSDIDCIVVLKNKAYQDIFIKERLFKFIQAYLSIHRDYNYKPDLHFPGDVITQWQMNIACMGKGLKSKKDDINLLPIKTDSDWNLENVDYRVWITEIAFNNNSFILGRKKIYERDRDKAVMMLLKYLVTIEMNKICSSYVLTRVILDGEETFLGFSRRYEPYFSKEAVFLLDESFKKISKKIDVKNEKSFYFFDKKILKKWKNDISKKQQLKNTSKPDYLYSWEVLRAYASKEWEKLQKKEAHCKFIDK